MPRPSKKNTLVRYRQRLDHAQRWREQEGLDETWKRMIDLYRGRHFQGASSEDRIAINMAFSTINVIFPSVTVNNPKITIKARKPEDDDRAIISEAVLNYWWEHHKFRDPFRSATKDALICGLGWVKVGWRYVEEEQPLGDEELEAEFQSRSEEAGQFAAQNPDLAGTLPTDDEIVAALPSTKVVVVEDRPYIERISLADMYVDPEATSLDDAKWLAQRIVRPIEDVKADENYAPGARSKVVSDAAVRSAERTSGSSAKVPTDAERVTVWEFYDCVANTMCAFSEMGEGYLIAPVKMPYAFGHPYEVIPNYEVPDEFYPMGDLEQLEAAQRELNATRTQQVNHRKAYNRKWLYKESSFGPAGRQALESDEDNVLVPSIDDNSPLGDQIVPLPINTLTPELYNHSEMIESDMDKISGVNEYSRGATPEVRRTATEAAIINDAANARAADKLGVIEAAIGRIARKVLMLAAQFLTTEEVARVVGADGASFWVPFDHDDVQGEFDFSVEGGSTQPHNETFQRQQALAMMQALGPLVGQVIDPVELARHVLQEGFGVKNPSKFLLPPMPPMMPGAEGPAGVPQGPQGAPGQPQEGPKPSGADAPQMDPNQLLEAQQMGGAQAIPPEILAQLEGQFGLRTAA